MPVNKLFYIATPDLTSHEVLEPEVGALYLAFNVVYRPRPTDLPLMNKGPSAKYIGEGKFVNESNENVDMNLYSFIVKQNSKTVAESDKVTLEDYDGFCKVTQRLDGIAREYAHYILQTSVGKIHADIDYDAIVIKFTKTVYHEESLDFIPLKYLFDQRWYLKNYKTGE